MLNLFLFYYLRGFTCITCYAVEFGIDLRDLTLLAWISLPLAPLTFPVLFYFNWRHYEGTKGYYAGETYTLSVDLTHND